MSCIVKRNRHDRLALRIYWDQRESWEGLGWPDTETNRALAQRIADQISAEIKAKTFTRARYLQLFPHGNLARKLQPLADCAVASGPTIGSYYAGWIQHRQPPVVRPALARDYRQHLTRYVLTAVVQDGERKRKLADLPVRDLRPTHLRALQRSLLNGGLKVKTVRNIIDCSFRAMVRDARKDDVLDTDPFAALDWPDLVTPKPDPFTAQERDQILAWFWQHRRAYYAFVFVLFHTGMRPSEVAALRWTNVDTAKGTVSIVGSRYLGSEGAPKTRGSGRTVKTTAEARAVLCDLKPLRVGPDDYVFTNAKNGGPINHSEWPKDHWHAMLRGTNIRPRKFYATRHTFISIALTRGVNLKWLAEYCGTSVMMIERNYGRFLPEGDEQQLQLLAGEEKPGNEAAAVGAKTETPSKGFGSTPKNPGGISVPDGI